MTKYSKEELAKQVTDQAEELSKVFSKEIILPTVEGAAKNVAKNVAK